MNSTNKVGISTSSIQAFDPVAMTVRTRSGKTYILAGPPETCPLGEAAWKKWSKENAIVAEKDVSGEYFSTDPSPTTVTFKKVGFRYGDAAC
ncbi:MAG: hypothetical protein Q7U91_05120 [Sideroxyarcus sp.]|nr:hypothetical protein [Sideroxyarcus sp.]